MAGTLTAILGKEVNEARCSKGWGADRRSWFLDKIMKLLFQVLSMSFYSDILASRALLTGEITCSRASQLLEIVKVLQGSTSFLGKLTGPEPTPPLQANISLLSSPQGQMPEAPTPQSPQNHSNWLILSLLTPSHPSLPMETTIKILFQFFSLFPLPPDQPWCFPTCPHGMLWPLLLGTERNKLSFQWQPLLMCWPHHT